MRNDQNIAGRFAHAISIEDYDFLDQSYEVARLWVEHKGSAACLIQPNNLDEPEMFGMLMVDCVRHAARAYAQTLDITEGDALERIWTGLDAERDKNTTDLDTVQNFGKAN